MSLEKSGENSEFLESGEKELVDIGFAHGNKLYSEALSVWAPVIPFTKKQSYFDNLQKVLHYEEYFKQRESAFPGIFEYVMEFSDAESITAFNQLVDEFNADRERIREEKDFDVVRGYYMKNSKKIIKGIL